MSRKRRKAASKKRAPDLVTQNQSSPPTTTVTQSTSQALVAVRTPVPSSAVSTVVSATPQKGPALSALLLWQDYKAQIATTASALIFGPAATVMLSAEILTKLGVKDASGWALYGGIALFASIASGVCGSYFSAREQRRMSYVSAELEHLKAEHAGATAEMAITVLEFLQALSDRLGCQNGERVTLYQHKPEASSFQIRARYSRNATNTLQRRKRFPDSQGCLAKAWEDGEHFCNDICDPKTEYEGYLKRQTDFGLTRAEAAELRMKSRLYAAVQIRSSDGADALGVLMVESINPNFATADIIPKLKAEVSAYFAVLLGSNQTLLPPAVVAGDFGL